MGRVFDRLVGLAPIRLWALILAGPSLTAFALFQMMAIWLGEWPSDLAAKRLDYLGWSLLGTLMMLGVVVAAISAAKVSGKGPGGMEFEIDADDQPTVEAKP